MVDMVKPRLIQGGMGVRISSAKLANATSRNGAIGVVSSVGLRTVVIEELRGGDEEVADIIRRFPIQSFVDEFMKFGKGGSKYNKPVPMDTPYNTLNPDVHELPKQLSAVAAFVEVTRAKQGHTGIVGINVMWKCALTVLPSIFGAMLAGVDLLLCGAGVPMELPDITRRIRNGESLAYAPLHGTETNVTFSIPVGTVTAVAKYAPPGLIPILSNFAFPKRMVDIWDREMGGARPTAFVLENHQAGGHNAPPRNKKEFGELDDLTSYFDKVLSLGVPVYVAGCGSSRADYLSWIEKGAYGLQIGSRFALCSDSGMRPDLRDEVIRQNALGIGRVETSMTESPTGYPFKYTPVPGTLSDESVKESRKRICNKGYLLKSATWFKNGKKEEVYRCPAMPVKQFTKLGGDEEETKGAGCLCNSLFATAGLGDPDEPALVTLGLEGTKVKELLTARTVVEDILTPEYVEEAERRLVLR